MSRSRVADSTPISVIVDDRETRAPVLAALRGMDEFDVGLGRLTLGDYRVDNRWLFERKTLTDLVVSIQSGRLFKQVLRLVEADEDVRPALILEGTSSDLQNSGMRWEAIQGALVTVSLFIGLPVLRTRNALETARTFVYIARQARTIAQGGLPRRDRRPKNKRALQLHVLQGLPGIGPKRAACLLARFGSVADIVAADPQDIAGLAGIGDRTARRIKWAVEEPSTPYRVNFATA